MHKIVYYQLNISWWRDSVDIMVLKYRVMMANRVSHYQIVRVELYYIYLELPCREDELWGTLGVRSACQHVCPSEPLHEPVIQH
jgi:hypothetical protein